MLLRFVIRIRSNDTQSEILDRIFGGGGGGWWEGDLWGLGTISIRDVNVYNPAGYCESFPDFNHH